MSNRKLLASFHCI